ncbi:MAG TPA: hypothetical protein VG148_00455 [Pyrinomonadaceae bacterium]|nr:hypothetical protein [Pyrinomonadaceae bacterium]
MRKTAPLLGACVALALALLHAQAAPQAEDPLKASLLLNDAEWYIEMKDPAQARALILQALAAARTDAEVRRRAGELWARSGQLAGELAEASQAKAAERAKEASEQRQKELKQQEHLARLDEAERLAALGEREKAATEALSVLKETTEKEVKDRAAAVLEANEPKLSALGGVAWQRAFPIFGWLLNVVLILLFLAAVYWLLKAARRVWAGWQNFSWWQAVRFFDSRRARGEGFREVWRALRARRSELSRWVVNEITETAGLGAAAAVTDSLNRWKDYRAPASAGLLKLEMLQLPSAPHLERPDVKLDLVPALEVLPLTIGGVNVGALAKIIAPLRTWWGAKRLWVSGAATTTDSSVTVRLTRRKADDTTNTVSASAAKAKVNEAAEAASYMMYYMIATDSSPADADAANKLKDGMFLLAKYASGREPGQLEAAYEAFRSARAENPSLSEAYLYEGIALDLMERRDEAIQRFEHVAQTATSDTLREKANYNWAVSLFRNYNPGDFDKAAEKLSRLTGLADDWNSSEEKKEAAASALVKSPLKSLAFAAAANVVAHWPIFWRHYTRTLQVPDEDAYRAAKPKIDSWVGYVDAVAERLQSVLDKSAGQTDGWDAHTRQQLNWGIQNARGNIRLNVARSFYGRTPTADEDKQRRGEFLAQAQEAFRECEMFLPPGVETLTNLATVMIELGRYDDSRVYSERAIKLNPNYEYAYYRLAEAWEEDNRVDEVVEVLKRFAKERSPRIREFRALYDRHSVVLAKRWAEAAAAAAPPAA